MRSRLGATGVLIEIAFRNLFASRLKTLIVGGIILFGACLVVVGSSLVDSVNAGMSRSIQGSLGGHIQVYNARSRDELAIYGGMLGDSDLEPLEDFARLKQTLSAVPNVKMVIPMGIRDALVDVGNVFDRALEKLRADVNRRLAGDHSAETAARLAARKGQLRQMITVLGGQMLIAGELMGIRGSLERADLEPIEKASTDAFWAEFDRDPLASLEFLENRIAPLSLDGGMTYLRYAGTDLDAFAQAFDRMHIVEGTAVPRGQRGILLSKLYAEDFLKLKTARRLDRARDEIRINHKTIAKDEELQRWVRENVTQTRDILLQLDPIESTKLARQLADALESKETDLGKLLVELLQTDDGNFESHYQIFYRDVVPLLDLYSLRVGDTLTIKAFARSGYMKSINVKIYGMVEFRGLEKSAFAGITSLMDLMSFRDLYGFLSTEQTDEIRAIKQAVGVKDVSREQADAALFGEGAPIVASGRASAIDVDKMLGQPDAARSADVLARVYGQDEIDHGVALNAAVIVHDPGRISETMRDIEAAAKEARLELKVASWQQAAGLVGQFITLARFILYVAVLIIFAVALVIINNAMVMATLQRITEIGTMRAIGAQRRFVLTMLLLETTAVGLAFGAVGAGLGAGIIALIRRLGGIAARSNQMQFFFSGPALLPQLGAASLIIALAIVVVVSILSGLYPALLAMRVTPLEAMYKDE